MAASITHAAIGAATSGLATAAIHQAALDAATVAGIDKTNVDSVTKLVTVGTVAPSTDGEITHNTTSLVGTGGPSRRDQVWNSTAGVALDFANAYYSATTPASGYQISGQLWYDMTLQLWRTWRFAATYDAVIAGTGLDGWHPLDTGFMLVQNETGSTITVGHAVAFAGTTGTRRVTPCALAKQQNVVGVVAGADITTGTTGIIACAAGGAVAKVYCNVTLGAVVAGDVICTTAVSGECTTDGPSPASPFSAATQSAIGTPCGAFAIALEDVAVAGNVMCRMLGHVGSGCHVTLTLAQAFEDLTPVATGTFTNFFPLRARTTNDGGQAVTNNLLVNAKHGIPVSVDLQWFGNVDSATAYMGVAMAMSKDGTNATRQITNYRYSSSPLSTAFDFLGIPLKSDGSVYYGFTPSAVITTYTTWYFSLSGYTY